MNNFTALFKGFLSRSKGILIAALLCSVGIVMLVISATNAAEPELMTIRLGFIDHDKSAVSTGFASYLTEDLGIELITTGSIDDMNTRLVEKRISGLIEVPAGFQTALLANEPDPVLLTFMGDYANEAFTRGYVDSYLQSVGALAMMAGGDSSVLDKLISGMDSHGISVTATEKDTSAAKEQADKDGFQTMISFILMFSFIMSICIATMLFSDRMAGTYRRIKAARVSSLQYVSSVAVIGILLMLLINGPALAIYALSGSDPGVPILATAGLMAAYSLFVIAFGLLIGLVMPGHGGIVAVIIAVTTITSMLGGAWFPVEMAPKLFQTLGHITPQYWFFEAVNAWQTGASISGATGPALVIVLAAVLFFILAGVQFTTNKSLSRI